MKKIYTPYTYLIGWSKLDKWYYGSRYATKNKCLYESGCHPDDFWVTYHTSSNIVTAFREEHGEPDVIQIRKTFSNADDAKAWEHRILQRMNVVKNDKWLNGNDRPGWPLLLGDKNPMYGRTGEKNPNYGKTPSEETKKKISEGKMGEKNPMYGRTGEKNPSYGKTPSQETRKKMSEVKMGEKNQNYGKTPSEETKKKISEGRKGKCMGEKNPSYGRTGEKHPMYGRTGEKNPMAKKIKVTYLGIEKNYNCLKSALKDYPHIAYSTLSNLASGRSKRSRKYPGLKIEYVETKKALQLSQNSV